MERAGFVAGTGQHAALGIDPLHRGHARERAASPMSGHFKLEPRDVACGFARSVAGGFGGYRTAVDVLPVGSRIMTADGLALQQQRRDRLAERPGQLAVIAGFALIDLRALGKECGDGGLARSCDGGRDLGRGTAAGERGDDDAQSERLADTHGQNSGDCAPAHLTAKRAH